MDIEVIFNIVIAVFAVFGVCSLIKLTVETLLLRSNHAIAVTYDSGSDPDEIGIRINRVRAAWHTCGASGIILIVKNGAELPPGFEQTLIESGVSICRAMPETGREQRDDILP